MMAEQKPGGGGMGEGSKEGVTTRDSNGDMHEVTKMVEPFKDVAELHETQKYNDVLKVIFIPANMGFLDRALRLLARWWMLMIFIPAILLLAFEASKLGWKQSETVEVEKRQLEGSQVLVALVYFGIYLMLFNDHGDFFYFSSHDCVSFNDSPSFNCFSFLAFIGERGSCQIVDVGMLMFSTYLVFGLISCISVASHFLGGSGCCQFIDIVLLLFSIYLFW
ncbi:uncharacterized protein LOC110100947 [Dendrobium catenatum]|uniref:uncharacterized protein LOC110100947 n=1 Tax=Dendrobium catenatum TaxID=906689 RepID=UPI0009F45C67|nr:uncharacterized protein LOC110100947 [Dendrobium catenatum]